MNSTCMPLTSKIGMLGRINRIVPRTKVNVKDSMNVKKMDESMQCKQQLGTRNIEADSIDL